MTFQHKRRQKANIWTDARANLILEVLGAMRVVKYFSYELPFMKRTEMTMIWFPILTINVLYRYIRYPCKRVERYPSHPVWTSGKVGIRA